MCSLWVASAFMLCRLTSLPDQLASLDTLTALDASYNQLEELPAGLSCLFQLASLIVNNNKLRVSL